jgi:hypothetical protein
MLPSHAAPSGPMDPLPDLLTLDLSHSPLPETAVAHVLQALPALEELHACGIALSGPAANVLPSLTQLRILVARGSRLPCSHSARRELWLPLLPRLSAIAVTGCPDASCPEFVALLAQHGFVAASRKRLAETAAHQPPPSARPRILAKRVPVDVRIT